VTTDLDRRTHDARLAAERHDFESAITLLRPLAEANHPDAQYQLARLAFTECELITGADAFELLQFAADQGHPDATYRLATFPEFVTEGFTSPLSHTATRQLFTRAAELGCVDAQYDLAATLATGNDGAETPDLPAAFHWYQRAALAGHPEAQFNLAFMLLEGEGCSTDQDEAIRWLNLAHSRGHAQAGRLLDDIDKAGYPGAEADGRRDGLLSSKRCMLDLKQPPAA
jgi:uncharacterized protein